MHSLLRQLFSPLLKRLETGSEEFEYKPSHRVILWVMGALFTVLASGSLALALGMKLYAGLLPGVVFLLVGVVALIVAGVGKDEAVARIWRNK